uniref:Uncharacterized protein n=1 Tax=Glossina palpalis gambiensis TaxID=67801 RepID=A0A1B0C5M5_9MUSC
MLDSGFFHYTNTTRLHTHINLLNQSRSNNFTEIFMIINFVRKITCGAFSCRYVEVRGFNHFPDRVLFVLFVTTNPKRNFNRTICDDVFHRSCLKASLNNSQHCLNCQTNLPIEDIFGQILTRQQNNTTSTIETLEFLSVTMSDVSKKHLRRIKRNKFAHHIALASSH